MSKKISVIGTGYVGIVAAVGLADFGNTVIGVDVDEKKIKQLNQGIPVIYEPGIEEYLKRNLKAGRLLFTSNINYAINNSEVIFLALATPPKPNGAADLSVIEQVLKSIASNLNEYKVIVTKSTVPVGTNRWIKKELKNKANTSRFDVVSNPEFLREGKAVQDFFHPDRIVVGYETEKARKAMEDIYRSLYLIQTPFVWCNLETAELIKYACNAFLATKITFINQLANLSEVVGGDIHLIVKAMGMDGRISRKFLHPGPGFGGSCFPKDTKAIASFGDKVNIDMSLIKEVIKANEKQKKRMVAKLKKHIPDLTNKIITILGLSFKAETDDIRESPARAIVKELQKNGVKIQAHDPKAIENFKAGVSGNISYHENAFDALKDAHALIICTEWNEYRNLNFEQVKTKMKGNIIIDTRNILNSEEAKSAGFIYEGVGRR